MLFERVLLSCLLVGTANAKALQATLTEGILVARTAAAEESYDPIELQGYLPIAAKLPEREVVASAATADAPSPTQSGLISICNAYYRVQRGDYCATVIDKFYGLTLTDFYDWNPAVKLDCSELLDGYYVCVGISKTAPSPTEFATVASGLHARQEPVPGPTQSGLASNCDKYYKVVSDDTCIGITYQHAITLSQFYSWNPAVGSNCEVLLAGYYVCVGVSETTVTTSPTSTTTSAPPTDAPEPTQPGIASDCTGYYEAQLGDTCVSIVEKFGKQGSFLTLSAFERWNPAVGNDCTNLLAGYFYCVATKDMY